MNRIKWILFFISMLLKTLSATEVWSQTLSLDTLDASVDIGETSTGIALDSTSRQGVCYHNQTDRTLMYAYFDGQDWQYDTVDGNDGQGKSVGAECALAFDGEDRPHIVYYNTTDREIRHAYHDGQDWRIAVVDDDMSYDILAFGAHRLSLKKNPLGGLGIAYYDGRRRDLIFGEWDGQVWALETVAQQGDSGRHPSLSYTSDGRPAISYMRFINNTSGELKYVEFDDNNWNAAVTLDSDGLSGRYSSLAFDRNDVPHVVYNQVLNNSQRLLYTNRVGGNWNASAVLVNFGNAFASVGEFVQMTFSTSGHAHLIYRYYFFSALFGRVFYIKLNTLYFADRHTPNRVSTNEQTIAFSAAPTRDYAGTSIAIDDRDHLVYAIVIQNPFAQTDAVHAGELTRWSPYVEFMTDQDQVAENDQIEIRWRDHDPDSNARIRFAFSRDFNDFRVEGTVDEDGADRVRLDTSGLEPGRYRVVLSISDDDFVTFSGARSNFEIRVPERVEPEQNEEAQEAEEQNQQQVAPQNPQNQGQQNQQQQAAQNQEQQNQQQNGSKNNPQPGAQPQQQAPQQQQPQQPPQQQQPQQAPAPQPQNKPIAGKLDVDSKDKDIEKNFIPPVQNDAGQDQAAVEEQQDAGEELDQAVQEADAPNQDDGENEDKAATDPSGSSDESTAETDSALKDLLSKTGASCSLMQASSSAVTDASVVIMLLSVAGLIGFRIKFQTA